MERGYEEKRRERIQYRMEGKDEKASRVGIGYRPERSDAGI